MNHDIMDGVKPKKEAKVMLSLRVPKYVIQFFEENHDNSSKAIREVLERHVKNLNGE